MDRDELLALLKDEHGIDVAELQAQVAANASLSNTLSEALTASGVIKLSNDETVTGDDIVGAVAQLASTNVELSGRIESLEKSSARKDAEVLVDGLVSDGKVTPAQRDAMVELRLTNTDLFDKLVPAEAVVSLSNETGVTPEDTNHEEDLDAEIMRLTNFAKDLGHVRD